MQCCCLIPLQSIFILEGLTYSVSNAFIDNHGATGTHFHSTNGSGSSPTLNVPNAAEVAGFFGDEEVKGLSEFNIATTPQVASSATLTFKYKDVSAYSFNQIDGLFGQGTYSGNVTALAYSGTNSETLSSYSATSVGTLNTFSTSGATITTEVSFDVTTAYNTLKAAASPSFGVRLELNPSDVDAGGVTFENFTLRIS